MARKSRNSKIAVLIVGAGPTGLTAAIELRRFGIAVRIVDELPRPVATSRAIGIQARTLEELELHGLADSFVMLGHKTPGGNIYGDRRRICRLDFSRIESKYNYLLFLSQSESERILCEALARQGTEVERGTKMVAVAQDSDAVTATLERSDGSLEEVHCAYLISAEGARSTVRASFQVPLKGKTLDDNFVLADLNVASDLPRDDFHIFSSEYGFLALFPMGGNRFRAVASNPLSTPSQETAPTLGELQAIYNQRSHIAAGFSEMSWSSWFHINSRMVERLKIGRVFLAGDAAHMFSPAGAQGMNMGMQDMMNLGWKLAMVLGGAAPESLLDTYEKDRIPVMRSVLAKTEGFTEIIATGNPVVRNVFNHLAHWIVDSELVQEKATSRISQIALNYRDSPLSEQHLAGGSLRAGDRVPDVQLVCTDATGAVERRQLFELLDPSRFTLLLVDLGDSSGLYREIARVVDRWNDSIRILQVKALEEDKKGQFTRYFGTRFSLVLIRPDAYIGFRGTEYAVRELARYCNRWLRPVAEHKAA